MNDENHARVKDLFLEVCSLDEASRDNLLAQRCGDDADLRAQVESLLAHHHATTLIAADPSARNRTLQRASVVPSNSRRAFTVLRRQLTDHRAALLAQLVSLVFLVAVGLWAQYGVEQSLREVLRAELTTVLDADLTALELWLDEQQAEAKRWARQVDVQRTISDLIEATEKTDVAGLRDAVLGDPELTELREILAAYVEDEEGRTNYAIVDRRGYIVAARQDADIGGKLNALGMADNNLVLAGNTRVAKPHPRGSFVADRELHRDAAMIWVGTPVRDQRGTIIATLNLGVDADDQFTRILSVARIGRSGETYAFDAEGWFLSDSRFTDELKDAGLIPDEPAARAIFNLQVRDPGINLMNAGYRPKVPSSLPLTKMATAAIARQDGIDVDGYRDYRGVPVIGAWKWLPEYGFGVATEVDYAEAYAPLRYPMIASWLPLLVLLVAAGGFWLSALHVARLQRQIGVARQLGPYTLEEKIGEGGIGVVYRARHALLRRPTAIKLLKPDKMTDLGVARFEREVQLASQLTHPHTIEIYDFGRTNDGLFFYAMEYLPGASLAQVLQLDGPQPAGRVVYILKQICGSLAEAHGVGLVHRDIKPHNIMLGERGGRADFVKVLDFGLVKSISDDMTTDLSTANSLTGTPLYMAPERLKDPLVADPRSDLYAVGAVGFNLLTGRSLFQCQSDLDVLYHVMNVVPTIPDEIVRRTPPRLTELILGCLAKDPADRPQSAAEILRVLDEIPGLVPWTDTDASGWWRDKGPQLVQIRQRAVAETQSVERMVTAAKSTAG